jgi:hypothetical protein
VRVNLLGTTCGQCGGENGYRPNLFGFESGSAHGSANKFCATGGTLSANDDVDSPKLTQEEQNALVDEARPL